MYAISQVFPGSSDGKESICNAGDWTQSLGWEDPLEKGMATHSSILAWRIPWREEPGWLVYGVAKNLSGLINFHRAISQSLFNMLGKEHLRKQTKSLPWGRSAAGTWGMTF